jgi:hypothetical protein
MANTYRFLSRGGPGLEGFLFEEYYKSRSQNKKLFADSRYLYQMLNRESGFTMVTLEELDENPSLWDLVFDGKTSFVFLKKPDSFDGKGVIAVSLEYLNPDKLRNLMKKDSYHYLELPVTQSSFISEIAPLGISTLNILSWKSELGEVRVFAAALQLTTTSLLDCMGEEGIWVNLDPDMGVVIDNGRQLVPFEKTVLHHPVSGFNISDISIPSWERISGFISDIYEKLELQGLLSFELVIQDQGPKLLSFPGEGSLEQWIRLGDKEFFNDLRHKV